MPGLPPLAFAQTLVTSLNFSGLEKGDVNDGNCYDLGARSAVALQVRRRHIPQSFDRFGRVASPQLEVVFRSSGVFLEGSLTVRGSATKLRNCAKGGQMHRLSAEMHQPKKSRTLSLRGELGHIRKTRTAWRKK